ncbi:MAG TPA: ABC transporter substrate-binding protein [Beijerinckiaceae bacterium]|jgi:ABC-type nitrate/sulfonate/bicarbonate transport system substrate-binding protein|nr:ABC transporter substrate-binding protein [Beijerinckiaceae bacterium]
MLKQFSLAALAAAMVAAVSAPAAAADLRIITFSGATNLPLWIAQDKGFYAKEGLNLTHAITTGSTAEVKDLYDGKYDLMSSAFDNIVAYAERQSDSPLPGPFDLVAVAGVHSGLNSVVVRPGIDGFAGIKGNKAAVDAAKSGYAIVLYQILQKHGLTYGTDYTSLAVGSTAKRFAALEDKSAAVAMIDTPTDIEAQKKGYKILADATTEIGAYQGSAIVVRRPWAAAHEAELAAFLRANAAASDYIYSNRNDTIAELKSHIKDLSDDEIAALYGRLTGPGGLNKHGEINLPGVDVVLKLRSEYGEPKKDMGPASKYVDVDYMKRALAGK